MKRLVAINGEVFAPEEAKISVFDRGFLFGDAIYEVTRSYGKIFYKIEAHYERLFRSAASLGFDLQWPIEKWIDETYRLYKLVNEDNYYMRLQITRGQGPIGMDPGLSESINSVFYFQPFAPYPVEYYSKGVGVTITSRHRNTKMSLDPNIKSGNYLNNVLAFSEGLKHKSHESIMINKDGYITECTTSNVFIVKNGVVYSTPDEGDILKGITRGVLFEICEENGIPIKQQYFRPQDLLGADEAFITASNREIMPISSVNGKDIWTRGPLVEKLQKGYKGKIKTYLDWASDVHPWKK